MYALNVNPVDQQDDERNQTEHMEPVDFNEGKFMVEDPKFVEHMNSCRDKFNEEENKLNGNSAKLSPEDIVRLQAANDQTNIEFTKLLNGLACHKTLFDDCTENVYRHVNAIAQILEDKKPPVGFPSLEPKKCFEKLFSLTNELSDKMQKNVKTMDKLIVELAQLKKNDELIRSKLLKHFSV